MGLEMRLPRGRAGLVGAIVLGGSLVVAAGGLFVLASGDDDDPPEDSSVTAPTATPGTQHLTTGDLPGSGWTTSETELVSLDDAPGPIFALAPDLPACTGLREFEATLFENHAAFVSGQSRSFERPQADGGVLRVTRIEVNFATAAPVGAILTAARSAIQGEDFTGCMLAAAALDGIDATADDGPALPIPAAGVARVVRYTATAASGSGTVTQAVGWWGEGEQLVGLIVSAAGDGPTDADLAVIARAAVGGGQ